MKVFPAIVVSSPPEVKHLVVEDWKYLLQEELFSHGLFKFESFQTGYESTYELRRTLNNIKTGAGKTKRNIV